MVEVHGHWVIRIATVGTWFSDFLVVDELTYSDRERKFLLLMRNTFRAARFSSLLSRATNPSLAHQTQNRLALRGSTIYVGNRDRTISTGSHIRVPYNRSIV